MLPRIPAFGALLLVVFGAAAAAQENDPAPEKIVIAHRGASGYLPEHTLSAKAMAYAMGAHYIEQDLVMTRDDRLIVLHDITLDRTTDVADKFPGRARADGRHYAIDFDLAEIRRLRATEGFERVDGERRPGFANRFPLDRSSFRVPTFAEEIELIQGLNHSTGGDVGIYPEIKQPEFHRAEGKDISSAVVEVLKQYGYTEKTDKVFLQTFSFPELEIIRREIMPRVGVELRLVLLLRDTSTYPWIFAADGMKMLAEYADGIGPAHRLIIDPNSVPGEPRVSAWVDRAQAAGLALHPFTFRADPGQLPAYAGSFADWLEQHYFGAGVDGLFTDFPDLVTRFLQNR